MTSFRSAHPKVAIALDLLRQGAALSNRFRVRLCRRRNAFLSYRIPVTLRWPKSPPTAPCATGLQSKRSHPLRKPRSTTVRVTKPVALGPLHPRAPVPFGKTVKMRGTLQSTHAAHTILFSMTSTRVLCGYLPWFPTSGDSPLHASETLRRAIESVGRAYCSRPRRDNRASDAPSPPIMLPERNRPAVEARSPNPLA